MTRDSIQPIRRRLNSHGQLVLLGNYRWDPSLNGLSTAQLRDVASGMPPRGRPQVWIHNSYRAQCARDELDRRMPRTASLCYDTKTGWIPLTEEER